MLVCLLPGGGLHVQPRWQRHAMPSSSPACGNRRSRGSRRQRRLVVSSFSLPPQPAARKRDAPAGAQVASRSRPWWNGRSAPRSATFSPGRRR